MLFLKLFFYFITMAEVCVANKVKYLSTEHPEVTWFHPKYFRYANMTAQRRSRADPRYFIGFHIDFIWPVYYNINTDVYLYEIMANHNKRSFLELHFDFCNLLAKELFFGLSWGQFFPYTCPIQPGAYHVDNLTVPLQQLPAMIPFTKARVLVNFTIKATHELLGFGHIDVEVKETLTRKIKN